MVADFAIAGPAIDDCYLSPGIISDLRVDQPDIPRVGTGRGVDNGKFARSAVNRATGGDCTTGILRKGAATHIGAAETPDSAGTTISVEEAAVFAEADDVVAADKKCHLGEGAVVEHHGVNFAGGIGAVGSVGVETCHCVGYE